MGKDTLGAAVLAAILASGTLGTCSGSPKETTTAATETQAADSRAEDTTAAEAGTTRTNAELKEIVVGASPAPHAEILNTTKEVLAPRGYELKTVEYIDYAQPNSALDSGDLDTNYFQHEPYLDSFNRQNGTNLISAGAIHYEPFGIYAGRTASLEELPDKAVVLMPNDVSGEARALLLLEAQGLVKLKDGIGLEAAKNDVVENTRDLNIVELEAAQLSYSISDGDIAVIDGSYAIETGLKVNDALATEDSQSLAAATYGNVVAVREGGESSDATEALVEALTSPEVEQFMEGTCEGTVVPLFQRVFAGSFQSSSFKIKHDYS